MKKSDKISPTFLLHAFGNFTHKKNKNENNSVIEPSFI